MRRIYKFWTVIYGIILATIVSNTVAEGSDWIKDPITGCAIYDLDPGTETIISWFGPCKEGKADGQGMLVWVTEGRLDGKFWGTMEGGKAQGDCIMDFWFGNGYAHYEGGLVDSRRNGRGMLILADKSRVEGEFKDDNLNGRVDYFAASGEHYSGDVVNNKAQGIGHQVKSNGEEYFGQFQGGKREGTGTLLLPNGDIYKGNFKGDLPQGRGRLHLTNGGIYAGEFHDGQPHGKGTYTTPDGDVARANFLNGAPDGKLIVQRYNGNTEEQYWEAGKKVKP